MKKGTLLEVGEKKGCSSFLVYCHMLSTGIIGRQTDRMTVLIKFTGMMLRREIECKHPFLGEYSYIYIPQEFFHSITLSRAARKCPLMSSPYVGISMEDMMVSTIVIL